jgi:hypothetical protein
MWALGLVLWLGSKLKVLDLDRFVLVLDLDHADWELVLDLG